ncbi:MAG TPA: hypothetical protein VF516_26730 [Kofleriaceae bacterium]
MPRPAFVGVSAADGENSCGAPALSVVLEAIAPGGQAGTSSKIENHLGFPVRAQGEGVRHGTSERPVQQMSRNRRIAETPNLQLLVETEIVELGGDAALERVTWLDRRTGERAGHAIGHVVM